MQGMAECDKDGQQEFNPRLPTRIMVDTTDAQDICINWDTTYFVNIFPPAKALDGEKIDPTKNRHILCLMFQGVPLISELVKYFEEKYTNLDVHSVWIIEKSREKDVFQSWHRVFNLGTEVTTTIAVNIGAVTKD
jgi:hypothetical protein